MALKLDETYPGRVTPPDADYPQGSIRNKGPSAGSGTPLDEQWANDILGFLQRLLAQSGITPSGDPDTAQASDYYDALLALFKTAGATFYQIPDGPSVDLDPDNGSIQAWTLGDDRTATAGAFTPGQRIKLMVTAGDNTLTWPDIIWVGGTEPTLSTTQTTVLRLWRTPDSLYGELVGNVALAGGGGGSGSVVIAQYTGGGTLTTGPEPGEGTTITLDGSGNLPPNVKQLAFVGSSISELFFDVDIPSGWEFTALSLLAPAGYAGGYTLASLDQAFDEYIADGTPAGPETYAGNFQAVSRTGVVTGDFNVIDAETLELESQAQFGGGQVTRLYIHETGEDVRSGDMVQVWITDPDYL